MRHTLRTPNVVRLNCESLEDRTTPATAFALSGTSLLSFDTAAPTVTQTTAITGVTGSETLVGIDFRPQNGLLYGLGVNAAADTATLYAISTRTGVATAVGTAGSIAFTTDGTTVVDLPDPATVGYGFDFNPAADRVRVVAGSLNFRADPNTGAGVDTDNNAGNGINPDGPVNTGTTSVDAAGYTNNQPNNGSITTLYTLDATSNSLFIQNPPNAGTQVSVQTITLGGSTLDFTAVNGFDIPAGVNAPSSNAAVTAGSAFAVLNDGSTTGLYSIDLVNGQATLIGNVGTGATAVQGLAIQSDQGGFPAIALSDDGASLLRFNTASPGTVTTQAISTGSLAANEVLVGIDFRPATGQLYGLGVNATADTATLYLIDPQTGALTAVGTPSSITFSGVDLPPATAGYGLDFNPTVDRLRVTTGSGLNFRVNPNTGAPAAATVDGAIIGLPAGSTGVSATAYTNSFGQPLSGGVTTQYTLDAASDSLFIQNPPNNGTQTARIPITVGGAPIDFTDVNGFDIPAGVRVGTSNTAVTSGTGYAALTVNGVTRLYAINLVTGEATSLGSVGAGATALAGLTLAAAPAGTISFGLTTFSATEGGAAVVTLFRSGGSSGEVTVTVTVTGGTATAGTDFASGPYTVTFPDGATAATLTIPFTDDTLAEGLETVTLALSAPTGGAVLGALTTATLSVNDNDTAGAGSVAAGPVVVITRADGTSTTVTPFAGFQGRVTTASGDVNGDGVNDVVVGAGVNGHVKVLDGSTGAEVRSFFPFAGFTGGVYVAAGDINNDGFDDVIVGATINGHVKVFDGKTGAEVRSFLAYPGFPGEVRVSSGDINNDGFDDIITGAGANGHVKVFSGATGAEIRSFLAFPGFTGGVNVASGDVDKDGTDDLVVGADANGHVRVFSGATGAEIRSFLAFPGFAGAARVGARDVNGDGAADLLVGAGPGGSGRLRTFNGVTLALLSEVALSDPLNLGVFVG
ncbi:FG-GAP repeat protein [Gemmata obscuriglobus]|uniref:Calx-beta domain-containing protein n=1 Tax=Gemmata obscuriglobus TaxID=114 RepID=A0A2Z3H2E4_9BACT|nr:DUF4394 domain-containing protein [Gemmata obscuriglobus]AWM39918.1 hypothetical protein C1280_24875 [Gemmata obscuriglobus]QEG26946.1 FG-GAP repeat protein [Gemmata obscuriglobus]VTS03128.1 probable chi partial : Uncharacterized protein OS=Singulisphaera acidiphila (strain ATCC BAA-1392 / DSM 18658 / VKM B-2454 / MOB10) GN=Sinac_6706 PE=4 SV=1: DUF4394: DUF4394: Calx-beta: VCBS: VCBS [Gemmata obscuriglobus UQM 2246]